MNNHIDNGVQDVSDDAGVAGPGKARPAPGRAAYRCPVPRSPAYTGEKRKAVTSPEYASRPSTLAQARSLAGAAWGFYSAASIH
jgi:hypothetical protein